MKVVFSLSRRVTTDGTAEALVRMYAGKTFDQRSPSGIRVPVRFWDTQNGCVTVPRYATPETAKLAETQRQLDDLSAFLYAAYSRACGCVTPDWLKYTVLQFHGITTAQRRTLADLVPEYIQAHTLAPGTRRRYAVMYNWLRTFRPLYLDTIAAADLQDIEQALRSEGSGQNTVATKMKALRAFIRFAVLQGYMQSNPFDRYVAPAEVYGSVTYLTAEERDKIAAAELTPALAKQRDIFVFQCWTGCRVSDLYALRRENITKDGFLQYIPGKTSRSRPVVVRVPLSPAALAILERYRLHAVGIFPFISTDKYNEAIRRIIRLAGVDRLVIVQDPKTLRPKTVRLSDIATSHIARRTFAANAFAATGSERIVSSMTGHSARSAAFERYTDVTDDMKRTALNLADKLPT